MVSVTPSLIAPSVLRALDTLIVLGEKPREMLREFADANRVPAVDAPCRGAGARHGAALEQDCGSAAGVAVALEPSRTERRRHLRKYAEGELPEDRSFYFRGPQGKLKLRAHNLILFMDLATASTTTPGCFTCARARSREWLRQGNQGRGAGRARSRDRARRQPMPRLAPEDARADRSEVHAARREPKRPAEKPASRGKRSWRTRSRVTSVTLSVRATSCTRMLTA